MVRAAPPQAQRPKGKEKEDEGPTKVSLDFSNQSIGNCSRSIKVGRCESITILKGHAKTEEARKILQKIATVRLLSSFH